jgi:hypothetical protein
MTSQKAFLVMAEFYRQAISEGRSDQVPILTLPLGGCHRRGTMIG